MENWNLPEHMDSKDPPPPYFLKYSDLKNMFKNQEVKIFDSCMSIVRDHIVTAALIHTKGNQKQAAELLGITRGTLRDYIRNNGKVTHRRLK